MKIFVWLGLLGLTSGRQAPLHTAADAYRIPGRFLIALHPGTTIPSKQSLFSIIPSTSFQFNTANINTIPSPHIHPSIADNDVHSFFIHEDQPFEVFTGYFNDNVVDAIRKHHAVMYVEEDQRVLHYDHEYNAPWGLSRLSSHERPKPSAYHTYGYAHPAGKGVTAYVIDTGIYTSHPDFEGRAKWGANFVTSDPDTDGNGHGTHCAGTIAGKKYGVAKQANLIAVKVLDSKGSGTMSGVVKGVEWAIQDHRARSETLGRNAPSVANMSLGGGSSPTLDRAVNAAVRAGIAFAVAAGNDNADACGYSPAASELAITVGATTKRDVMAYFSNHGSCVDIFAPGDHILSTWNQGSETRVLSGTSMASPHTAGVAALHLSVKCAESKGHEYLSSDECLPASIKQDMMSAATMDVLAGLPDPDEGDAPDDDWPFPWPPRDPNMPKEGPTRNALLWVTDPDREDAEGDGNEGHGREGDAKGVDEVDEQFPVEEEELFHILPLTTTAAAPPPANPVPNFTLTDAATIRSRIARAIKPVRDEAQERARKAMENNVLVNMVDAIFG